MKKTLLATAAGVLLLAGSAQAGPVTKYFECTGATPVQTIDVETYSWTDVKPADSFQSGAGCGWVDSTLTGLNQPNTLYDASFGGDYKGQVSRIDLTLYSLFNNPLARSKTIDVTVFANGAEVGTYEKVEAPFVAAGNVAGKYVYTLGDLDIPATTRSRDIVIAVMEYYADDVGAWVFGASEVPAGATLYAEEDLPEDGGGASL